MNKDGMKYLNIDQLREDCEAFINEHKGSKLATEYYRHFYNVTKSIEDAASKVTREFDSLIEKLNKEAESKVKEAQRQFEEDIIANGGQIFYHVYIRSQGYDEKAFNQPAPVIDSIGIETSFEQAVKRAQTQIDFIVDDLKWHPGKAGLTKGKYQLSLPASWASKSLNIEVADIKLVTK